MSEQTCTGDGFHCPVEITLSVIGGKWKAVLLWHLREQVLRFGELKKQLPDITQKMLTQQLRELEQDGLISRTIYAEVPPRVEYAITDYGRTLLPILQAMCAWGQTHWRNQERLSVVD